MKTVKKPKFQLRKVSKRQWLLYGGLLLVLVIGFSMVGILRNSKQLALQETIDSTDQKVSETLKVAAKQNAERIQTLKDEQQKITDAEQAKKSAAETQTAEDKAVNRYSNIYGASKVYEATCSTSTGGSYQQLTISFDRSLLNAGSPFTVSISTPDGKPLGLVYINATGGFTANPSSFSSNGSSTSFTAQYPPGYSPIGMGPSMSTGGPTPYISVSASCNGRSYGAGISLF